jgi:hypothetical protein
MLLLLVLRIIVLATLVERLDNISRTKLAGLTGRISQDPYMLKLSIYVP